jgi:hypothetical protein
MGGSTSGEQEAAKWAIKYKKYILLILSKSN